MNKKAILDATTVPDIQHSVPEVFIFESLGKADEIAKRYEGLILADMLRLAGKNPKYYYFQSEDELPHLMGLFRQSKYRYLHISSHASATHIGTTNGNISYAKFAEIFAGHLQLRRLFFSACQVGNANFVNAMAAKNKGMHSIVAPAENIQFDHAAALWSTFYISLFSENEKAMKRAAIEKRIKALTTLFPVNFFFAAYDAKNDKWKHQLLKKA
ncbi:MAG TPA: hypothetical protein PLV48_04725 [Rhodocyclaceae bacterium]|nr:hypothetical protein [Rhodocyclaceae bacterium]